MLQGAEVGVVTSVLEDGENFARGLLGGEELVRFAGGDGKGFFDDDWVDLYQ